jgi:hypothetical protein
VLLILTPPKREVRRELVTLGLAGRAHSEKPIFLFQRDYWLTEIAKLDLSLNSNLRHCLAKSGIHNPD